MPSNYELIQFQSRVGATSRRMGRKVRDDLVVTYSSQYELTKKHKIFSIASGRPVIDAEFGSLQDAIAVAEFLDDMYRDYWCLLDEYPRMDIPQVCMWSVPNGVRTFVALTSLGDRDTITITDIKAEMRKAQVSDYMTFQPRT